MKKLALLLLICALGPLALAQQQPVNGTVTTASAGVGNCVSSQVTNSSTVAIIVSGTWTGTLTPTVQIYSSAALAVTTNKKVVPLDSTTAQATITANGTYKATVSGFTKLAICATAWTSGTANIQISASSASDSTLVAASGGGSPAFSAITPGTNTSGAMVEGTASSLSTSGIGQVASTQDWWTIGPLTPVFSSATQTGGSLLFGHGYSFRYTYISAAGESLPGGELQLNGPGGSCVSGSACTITLTSVTLPTGYSSYNTYMVDCGSGTCSGGELLLAACTHLASGTACTATIGGSGALPSSNTAFLSPSPLGTNLCSPGTNPIVFISDGTTYYPYMGVDNANTGTNPPAPYNKLSICRPFWVNDTGTDPPQGRNALSLFFHLQNGVTVNSANQDRAIQIFTTNCLPIQTCSDSSTHYGLEGLQIQQYINGTPTINGSPDGEVTAGSFQMTSYNTASYASTSFGTNAIRATMFRQTGASIDSQGLNGLNVQFSNSSTVTGGNLVATGIKVTCGSGVAVTNLLCANIEFIGGTSTNPMTQFNEMYIPFSAGWNPRSGAGDYGMRNDNYNLQWMLGGPLFVNTIGTSDSAVLAVGGDVNLTGSLTTIQQTIPNIGSVTCTGGASQYTYQLVGIDTNGGGVKTITQNTPSTCVNPLTSGNPATINTGITTTNELGQFSRIDVYRTGGPMGTGKIGFISVTGAGGTWTCNHSTVSNNFTCTVTDTGLTADGGTVPSVNTTGGIGTPVGAVSHLAGNMFQVASNFTTAANTSLQAITGLVINLPQVAQNYSFHCAGSYSQATGTAAVAFGIQSATVAPTNIFANGQIFTASGTVATGTLATLTTTTATNVMSGTPGAIATNNNWQLDGTIEEPSNDAGNVINILVSTATSGDAVTVLRGSYCRLY